MRRAFALVCLLLLAACSNSAPNPNQRAEAPAPATEAAAPGGGSAGAAADATVAQARTTASSVPATPPPAQAGAPAAAGTPAAPTATAPMLAYTYFTDLVAPADHARALMMRHQALCVGAGPLQCQVVSANESRTDADQFTGTLVIRAVPAWMQHFRDGLEADAQGAGGHVTGSRTESEDLTRSIVDSEAAVRAKTTLRDRLQTLVATHQGSLEDVLNAERALADVNTEIDQLQSELAVMRTRVNTSTLNLTYNSQNVLATRGAFQPLSDAISGSAHLLAGSLAILVAVVVFVAPWALLIGGLVWLFRKWLPTFGRRPSKPPAVQAPTAPPPSA